MYFTVGSLSMRFPRVAAQVHGGNVKLPLEPFSIISQCCKEPRKCDTTSRSHREPGRGEERWGGVKGAAETPVLFSQPLDSGCMPLHLCVVYAS